MLLMSTVPIMGAVLAWMLFDETLRPIEITGIALGVGGVLIVILGKKGRPVGLEGRNYIVGILFGLGGAVGQVANLITAKYALIDGYSALSATWIRTLVAVIAMWGLAVILGRVRRTVTACLAPDVGKWLLLGALIGPAIGVWLSMLAVQNANVGIASTLMALPPVLLIIAVLGAILGGVATPTEAASVGAIGAILMAGVRQGANRKLVLSGTAALLILAVMAGIAPVRFQRNDLTGFDYVLGAGYVVLAIAVIAAIAACLKQAWKADVLKSALTSTMTVTSMIFATILTASMFSLVFIGLGGEDHVAEILEAMPGGPTGALLFCMGLIFILGFFLDFVEITVILLPLIAPGLIMMGHDPVWLAILIAINLQTSFLTPPFGFSLFYLRSAAPPEITTGQIYKGVVPFIGLQIFGMAVIWFWPALARWLPSVVF